MIWCQHEIIYLQKCNWILNTFDWDINNLSSSHIARTSSIQHSYHPDNHIRTQHWNMVNSSFFMTQIITAAHVNLQHKFSMLVTNLQLLQYKIIRIQDYSQATQVYIEPSPQNFHPPSPTIAYGSWEARQHFSYISLQLASNQPAKTSSGCAFH